MLPRRPHTKSRLGCMRCKQKHIKCDEVRPTCGACTRYKVPCVLKGSSNSLLTPTGTSGDSPSHQHEIEDNSTSVTKNHHRRINSIQEPKFTADQASLTVATTPTLITSAKSTRKSLSIWEFELLHHYIIHVTESFGFAPAVRIIWSEYAIQEATQHEFLFHIILMVSCLHLALTKSPRFTQSHHNFIVAGCSDAVSWFRQEVEHINDSNWRVVSPFAFLMSIYSLALPLLYDNPKGPESIVDDTIQVLALLGATRELTLLIEKQEKEDKTPRAKEEDIRDTSGPIPSEEFDIERVVKTLVTQVQTSGDAPIIQSINSKAIDGLRTVSDLNFTLCLRPLIWPCTIERDFLDLLTQRNPTSMAILAHYAIILCKCGSLWWCADWGTRILSAIVSLLPDDFSVAIAYPLEILNRSNP